MYELHYDYIKYGNNSRLYSHTDGLMYKIKTEVVCKVFHKDKEMFHLSNYSAESRYYDNWNKLAVGKMKDETAGAATEEFVRVKSNIYLYLVDDNSEHKKAKGINKNFAAIMFY